MEGCTQGYYKVVHKFATRLYTCKVTTRLLQGCTQSCMPGCICGLHKVVTNEMSYGGKCLKTIS